MPQDPRKDSPFYNENPSFGGVPAPQKRPRLEGNRGLLIITLVIFGILGVVLVSYFINKGA